MHKYNVINTSNIILFVLKNTGYQVIQRHGKLLMHIIW